METFTASFDRGAIIWTLFPFCLVAGIGVIIFIRVSVAHAGARTAKIIMALVFISLFAAFPYSVRYYALDEDALVIKRQLPLLNVEIPYSQIKSVRAIDPLLIEHSNRDLGDDGLFGYIGNYSSNILGKYKLYATNSKFYVMIDLKTNAERNRIVLSPDDTNMIHELRSRMIISQSNK